MNTIKKIAIALAVLMVFALAAPATADYAGDKPLVTTQSELLDTGGLVFETVTDGSAYTVLNATESPMDGDYKKTLTQPITIRSCVDQQDTNCIPPGATVKKAILYNYYTWSTSDNDNVSVPGCPAEANITFNGVTKVCVNSTATPQITACPCQNPIYYGTDVVQYWDSKGQGYTSKKYDYPTGTFAWDVTGMVTGSGTYTATITNADSTPTGFRTNYAYPDPYRERFATYGFGLLVVYEVPKPGAALTDYWVSEGTDMLYGSSYYGVTPEQATTSATFANERVDMATLITVVTASDKGKLEPPKNMVYWNLVEEGPSTAVSDKAIGVNYFDVKIEKGQNMVEFQDRKDYMTVRNAFLVDKKPGSV